MVKKKTARKNRTPLTSKAKLVIVFLFVLGIVVGILLSYQFYLEANDKAEEFGHHPGWQVEPFSVTHFLEASFGVVLVSITLFLLTGLLAVYIQIYRKTKSNYILGLLLFFIPMMIKTYFDLDNFRTLFWAPAIPFQPVRDSLQFSLGGNGLISIIIPFFEIIGLTIILYLSLE